MIPFIEGEPFSIEHDASDPTTQHVEIRLRVVMTEPTAEAPEPSSTPLEFVLDTGADYTSVYPEHLDAFGIPLEGPSGGPVEVTTIDDRTFWAPTRAVTLWLFGNIAGQEYSAYPVSLSRGVVILPGYDSSAETADPVATTGETGLQPLLGINSLLDARLKVEIDADSRRFSAWIPAAQPSGSV